MILEAHIIQEVLGSDPKEFTIAQVAMRALLTYLFTVLLVKISHKRFLGEATTFDAVLGFILGSVMSRAVNGQSAFIPTLAGGFVLVGFHWCIGWVAIRSKGVANFFKGVPHVLMRNGKSDPAELRKHLIGMEEIEQYMRQTANIDSHEQVETATLERSGKISIVKRPKNEPRILNIEVHDGVQRVQVEFQMPAL